MKKLSPQQQAVYNAWVAGKSWDDIRDEQDAMSAEQLAVVISRIRRKGYDIPRQPDGALQGRDYRKNPARYRRIGELYQEMRQRGVWGAGEILSQRFGVSASSVRVAGFKYRRKEGLSR